MKDTNMNNNAEAGLKQSFAAMVYGEIVYWLSIVACFVCTIAPILTVAFPENNFLNPYFLFARIWEKTPPDKIWMSAGESHFDAWFWTRNLSQGDGLIMFGLVLGCSCACIGLIGASLAFFFRKGTGAFLGDRLYSVGGGDISRDVGNAPIRESEFSFFKEAVISFFSEDDMVQEPEPKEFCRRLQSCRNLAVFRTRVEIV